MVRIIRTQARRPRRGFPAAVFLLLLALVPARPSHSAGRFPVEIRDDRGVVVRLAAPPRRIVSLAPSLTEIVFLLGKGDLLAGATRFCNHPPPAAFLPRIGGMTDPDVERVVSLSPDLVLCTTDGNPRSRVETLEEMGIPCFAAAPQDLSGVIGTVERLGVLLGDPARGRAEAATLSRRIEAARAAARAGGVAPLALVVVSASPVIVAGEGTFMDELLRLAGARNAARAFRGRYPRLSVEDFVAVRPDAIFIAGMKGTERFPPEVTGWKEVPAFRNGAVFHLDGDLVTRPGPRLVTALEEISAALAGLRSPRGGGR